MKKTVGKFIPGSKIPASYLFDYLKDGYTLSDFLSAYPWLKREDVEKTIEKIKKDFSSHYAL